MSGPSHRGGYLNLRVAHLNGRLFNRLLAQDGEALYSSEQGKILSALWSKHPQTATDLAIATGLANSTLTSMLRRLISAGLVCELVCEKSDRRKKYFDLTELGLQQQEVGQRVSQKLAEQFYKGFSQEEIEQLESLLERVSNNLATAGAASVEVKTNSRKKQRERSNSECYANER